jgi:glucan phosphoethanolaminetransferase (alkaline phosphatase superfamily)
MQLWQYVRVRRWLARGLIVLAPTVIVAYDYVKRAERIATFDSFEKLFYFASGGLGVVLWSALLFAATRRRGMARWPLRIALGVCALLCVGGQIYTYSRYGAYMNHRAVLVGTTFLPSIGQQLWFDRWAFLGALTPAIAIAVAVPLLAERLAPMRRRSRALVCIDIAVITGLLICFISPNRGAEQGQPPDVMYVSAMGQLLRARWEHNETVERLHPGPRSPEPVPKFTPKPSRPRNVLMIVTESVRAQSVCIEYSEDCKYTPFSNKVVPDRIPITQMRALDSTTAISLSVMWDGLMPTRSREDLHKAPLLWEYAATAGIQSAYYTSQNLLFGNSGLWLGNQPWTRHVSATQIEPDATYEIGADDGKLVDYVIGDIGKLKEPWFAVVHLSNTHFPYKIDPEDMPFSDAYVSGRDNDALVRYQDSIRMQDKATGRLLEAVRGRPESPRTVIVFVSDHGEQMREHGAVGHTGTVFDPEIRIPFWLDAPPGTITYEERASITALKTTPLTHLDIFPTMMDLLGFWDAPELATLKKEVPGTSLLRGGSKVDTPLILTNCTDLWACAFRNWGAIRGTRKLIAHQGENMWGCYDLTTDPGEEKRLDVNEECADLLPLVEGTKFGKHPW